MKKIVKYVIFSLLILPFAGCDDFLTEIPESNYSVAGSYKTQTDFTQAIAGVYDSQQSLFLSNESWLRTIIGRTDEVRVGGNYFSGLDTYTETSNVPILATYYANFWTIINRSNLILDNIEAGTFTDANLKNYIKGEALAMRAYAYQQLATNFGGMPLITTTLGASEVLKIARSTQQQTFDQVEADYKAAYALLPETWTGANLGRITKYAAAGMLGRLYMFEHKYPEAVTYLGYVITSRKYSMETKYVDCFTDSKDNGPERVWEVQFTGGQLGEGQRFSTGCMPERYSGTIQSFFGYSSCLSVGTSFAGSYEAGDLRKDVTIITNLKVNGVVDAVTYYIYKYSHADKYTPATQTDWAINIPILRYTDVKMMYAEALNEVGYVADGDAFTILNDVRGRAGLTPLTSTQLPDKTAFREAMIKERRVEFAFEGLRWNDLVRWGIAEQVMNARFLEAENGATGTVARYNMKATQMLFPIPYEEMNRYNDINVMWQNPE